MDNQKVQLRVGDWVEIKSKDEILSILDQKGQLEGLPFMPEMFKFCGKRFPVHKRAHKTCDTVNDYKGRKMKDAVHLDGIRCDGHAHGGCGASCLIFWKHDWLKKVSDDDKPNSTNTKSLEPDLKSNTGHTEPVSSTQCTESNVMDAAFHTEAGNLTRYFCQATHLPAATESLKWWDVRQYFEDYTSGNVKLGRMFCGLFYMAYNGLINSVPTVGTGLRWIYDSWMRFIGGIPYPRRFGLIPVGTPTPTADLNLQPGEKVKVRSLKAILATLDKQNKNRGLYFDAEMVPYCEKTFTVLKRIDRIVDEKSGTMRHFKTPCILLEGASCQARYSECRLFCPRHIYSFWREIWLERI